MTLIALTNAPAFIDGVARAVNAVDDGCTYTRLFCGSQHSATPAIAQPHRFFILSSCCVDDRRSHVILCVPSSHRYIAPTSVVVFIYTIYCRCGIFDCFISAFLSNLVKGSLHANDERRSNYTQLTQRYTTTRRTSLHYTAATPLTVVPSCTAMWLLHSSSHRCSSGVRVTAAAAAVIIVLLTLTTAITTNAQNTNTANDAASTLVEQTPIASSVVASPSLVVASYPFDGSSLCDSSLAS